MERLERTTTTSSERTLLLPLLSRSTRMLVRSTVRTTPSLLRHHSKRHLSSPRARHPTTSLSSSNSRHLSLNRRRLPPSPKRRTSRTPRERLLRTMSLVSSKPSNRLRLRAALKVVGASPSPRPGDCRARSPRLLSDSKLGSIVRVSSPFTIDSSSPNVLHAHSSHSLYSDPAPADDFDRLLEETDSKPAPSELAIEPPKRTASTNPYAALISNSGSASPNPYATTASSQANPYAPPAASLNPYMTPSLPSSAVFGSARASPSTSSPYASVSPNPYATSTSPNPYSANFTSPPAPKPAAPPPFVRKTTQTYDAYDPPSMPTIPVRRARGPSPWGGAVSAIASPLGGSNQALPSTTSGMSSPKPPPPPPPKRTDSYAQAPPPPKTFSPPPPPPSTVRAPPPLSSAARAFSPPPPRTVSSPLNSMRAAPPPGRPTPPARAAPPPARALPPPAARAPSPSVFKASSPGPPLDNAQRNVEPRQSLSPSLGSPDVEDRVDEEGRRAEVLDRGSFEVGKEVDEEGGDYEGGSFDAGSVEMLILEEEEKPRERTLSEQLSTFPPIF
jgi:hypothetical protein